MQRRGCNDDGFRRSRAGGSDSIGPLFFGVDLPECTLHVLRAKDLRGPPSARGPKAGQRNAPRRMEVATRVVPKHAEVHGRAEEVDCVNCIHCI